ncbi:MAG: hypothetical protein E6I58_04910 [Chloroflexi bacterium]|nr:MAG: hypothetical protein E6I58_04910 [Chloroflexota bacterium]
MSAMRRARLGRLFGWPRPRRVCGRISGRVPAGAQEPSVGGRPCHRSLVGVGGLQFFGADLDLTVIGAAIGVPMELGGGGLWLFSIVDAYRTAKRMESGGS